MAGLAFDSSTEQPDIRIKRFPNSAIGQLPAENDLPAGWVSSVSGKRWRGTRRKRGYLLRRKLLGVAQETGLRRRDAGKELVVRVEQACGCPVSVGQRLDVLSFAVTRGAKGALRGLAGLGMKIPVAYRYLIR